MDMQDETICALSTPVGEAALGVIRLSGPRAIQIAQQVFQKKPPGALQDLPTHTIHYGQVVDPETGETLDEVLLSLLRKPRSYTREDMVEISCHGAPLLLKRVVDLLIRQGARLAEPGEFTKRAFLNGRIDLSQAEAVMDLICSKTEAGLKAAFKQLQGRLGREIGSIYEQLFSLLSHIEANIDFCEEGLEVLSLSDARRSLVEASERLHQLLDKWQEGRILREGLEVAIIGRPNVGKSSLLNLLVQEDRAIVSPLPGTTRDVLEVWVNFGGIALKLMDMAGLRQTHDPVELEGVRRARWAMEKADLVLLVLDASQPIQDEDRYLLDLVKGKKWIGVLNKTDLTEKIEEAGLKQLFAGTSLIKISAVQGKGLDRLKEAIQAEMLSGGVLSGEPALLTSTRHAKAVEQALKAVQRAVTLTDQEISAEFIALEIRTAMDHLGGVIGKITTDDLLDRIFSRFCIGK